MIISLPDSVGYCIRTLGDQSHQAYIVGGCVRDSLLGRPPHDWDICTSATPQQVAECFAHLHTIPTGIAHGTVTVMVEKEPVEITTFRRDGSYADHRRPDQVEFTGSLEEDLARRDFTVNAMAYHPDTGLADPQNGASDLERRLLRCVGNPLVRFEEDALRILRLFRFAARLEFSIDPASLQAAQQLRDTLSFVSPERIYSELRQLLMCRAPGSILEQMLNTGVLQVILPEFAPTIGFHQHTRYHHLPVDRHILASVDAVEPQLVLRLTMLLHDIGKPQCLRLDEEGVGHFKGHATLGAAMSREILTRLHCDKATMGQVERLIALHDSPTPRDALSMRRLLSRLGEPTVRQLLAVKLADTRAKDSKTVRLRLERLEACNRLLEQVLAEKPCLSLKELAVSGRDLAPLGLAGPSMGILLDRLLDYVLENPGCNRRDILLDRARALLAEPEALSSGLGNPPEELA